ncbi:hypothetical protein RE628_11520 [Paenibacillus sp. D2_2]|uniref:hypothetical protein n=1 Tax=Paenibacillus sp. D2_2 TaxID=3073092 RepID=UPI002814C33F|nr:hypothetical protein [Paenibacillus sp. D2_2]WMT42854.1 hypothetical protein RE628_11520 [Paenibacillus sp. D2_2]
MRQPDREFKVKAVIDGDEYGNRQIVDFKIDNSIASDGFEIGTAIPSTLTINIRTTKEIKSNSKVIPYIALSTSNLTWEQIEIPWNQVDVPWNGSGTNWLPLGEFFVDKRERINNVWTFTCLDKLVFADVAYISSLTYPATMKAVWDEIMRRLGWTYDSSVVINSSYMIQVGPAGYTMRQVLAYIAGANAASVIVGKDGVIRFKRFSTSAEPVFEMTPSDYIRAKQTNPIKQYTRMVVTYNTEDDLSYESGSGDENHTLSLENPFMTQTMVNNLLASLKGFAYLPLSMDARGFPQLEHGDIIGFEQDESAAWIDIEIPWNQVNIPWNGIVKYKSVILKQAFSFKGGLKMSIDSPSISEQQSEFVVEGSLTQQVNKLDKTAVKEGKKYYGATITRTEGLIIEREDHLSKAVFNSDELTFYANNEKALWFDLPNRKFKFSGTLEGVDGKFTGTIEGGSFIGGSIQIGSAFSVNNAGHMKAVGAEFSGTISAAIITGGQISGTSIYGVTVTGSTISTRVGSSKGIVMNSGWSDLEVYSGVSSAHLTFMIEDLAEDAGLWFNRDGLITSGREIRISAPGGVFVNGVRIG